MSAVAKLKMSVIKIIKFELQPKIYGENLKLQTRRCFGKVRKAIGKLFNIKNNYHQ